MCCLDGINIFLIHTWTRNKKQKKNCERAQKRKLHKLNWKLFSKRFMFSLRFIRIIELWKNEVVFNFSRKSFVNYSNKSGHIIKSKFQHFVYDFLRNFASPFSPIRFLLMHYIKWNRLGLVNGNLIANKVQHSKWLLLLDVFFLL